MDKTIHFALVTSLITLLLAACSHTQPNTTQHGIICKKITHQLTQNAINDNLSSLQKQRLLIQYRGFHCGKPKKTNTQHTHPVKLAHRWGCI